MRFASVCSGIESASVAYHPLGWRAAWFAETDKACSRLLRKQFPDTPNHGDLTTLAARVRSGEVEPQPLLVGGTPCQDFSIAGLRQGLSGARGALTLAFVDLADAFDEMLLDPCVIKWENVPGVLNHKNNPFGNFLAALVGEDVPLVPSGKRWTDAGLVCGPKRTAAWRCLDAQYFGLAQRRKRVFVVASARHDFDPGEVLLEFKGVRRDIAPSRDTGQEIAGTLDARTDGGGFPGTDGACANHVVPATGVDLSGVRGREHGEQSTSDRHANVRVVRARPEDPVVAAYGGGNCSGPIAAAAALNANERFDFDSETFVVQPKAYSVARDVLDRSGEASDGSAANRSGLGIDEEIAATLKGKGPGAVCVTGELTHALTAEGFDASEDGTGRGNPIVVHGFNGRMDPCSYGDMTGTLDTDPGTQALAVSLRGRDGGGTAELGDNLANALRASTGGGDKAHVLAPAVGVRRLLPVECERLQGFPDGWTEGQADGPRYKQLGNSKAVPVVRWIGARIAKAI